MSLLGMLFVVAWTACSENERPGRDGLPQLPAAHSPVKSVTEQWTEWTTSPKHEWLAIRVRVESQTVDSNSPVVLCAELANRGEGATVVIKPFGDWYAAEAIGVDLTNQDGESIAYSGPIPGYTLGSSSFLWLEAGESITDRIEIHQHNFAGSEKPGSYTLRYTYQYAGEWSQVEQAKSAWEGKIVSEPVTWTLLPSR